MNFKNALKIAPLALAALAFNSQAGVSATSYLEISDLFILIDVDGDNVADDVNPLDFIQILEGTRDANTNAIFNGVSSGNTAQAGAVGSADASLVCNGPDCAGLGLTNNGQTFDAGNLVATDAFTYSLSDVLISGNALGQGASGFTYSDVGIAQSNNTASASTQIFNNILTRLTLSLNSAVNIAFVATYDVFVDAVISPDVTLDNTLAATASAEASFSIDVNNVLTRQSALKGGLSFSDFAFDVPGLGNTTTFEADDASFFTGFFSFEAGTYQLAIAQDSDVQASLIPEPGSLAILGLGLFGLALQHRRKS